MFSFLILLLIICGTIYAALMYINASIMLLVYMEVAFFVISVIYVLFRKFTVKGGIKVPIGISEIGKDSVVKIKINNKSIIPIVRAKVLIIVKDMMSGSSKKYWMKLSEISRGEVSFVRNIVFQRAGNYEIVLKKLKVYDMTGLMYGSISVKSAERVEVMPKLYDVPVRVTAVTKNFYGESDVYDEHFPGHDNSELFQVRSYQKGDRIQNVHWKMTAKQDELMVKEHSLPKSCPVVLFLDFKPDRRSKKKLVTYIEIAVSISFSIMDAGCSHYIVWYDSNKMDIVRIRVDDEESLFYFIGMLMKVKWIQHKEDIVDRYKEKYRAENYVYSLSLDEKLILKKDNEIYAKYEEKNLQKSLSEVELLL